MISHEIMSFWVGLCSGPSRGRSDGAARLWCAVSFGQWHPGKRGESKRIARHPVRIWRTGDKGKRRKKRKRALFRLFGEKQKCVVAQDAR